ncbi:HNH endonuclease [Thermodesulfobacteriota bacterium]
MCGKIDCYQQSFAGLRTDKNRTRWTAQTSYRAPHKPFLLLAVLDLIDQGLITREFIEPSFELAETFQAYWQRIMPPGKTGIMAYPFFHLSGEPFWKLVPRPGIKVPQGQVISSMKKIRELYLGARIDPELFKLLLMEPLRERLRAVLITTYFPPEIQPLLVEEGRLNSASYEYSRQLIMNLQTQEPGLHDEIPGRVRDQGFRKAIVRLYGHRCALCGIRMLTPDGHTVVEAAHIIPWSESKNDTPTNGMALCRICHWSFDEGMMTVGKKYEVKVSKTVRKDNNYPGHILTLTERPIFRPDQSKFWPDQDNLDYHRKKIFIK